MSKEVTATLHLAWLVGMWHLLVAGWLVFFVERHERLLTILAIVKGLLGAAIYLIVRDPVWAFYTPFAPYLLPATLLLLFVFSALVTWLIWCAYDLDAPQKRLRALVEEVRDWR